ncbi:Peroxisomal targeting signal 2 receptor [Lachnellula occidentalis]|uniref:Peroxin-7 n=1 Tax=Lachnellula occidentalis TaxID=215460 RepID=A0A8H8S2M4_9HELO|nr:Peroxisomal targeting signal 2 receptor [Lachnellula occidentalis]
MEFRTQGYNGYAVKYSPFFDSRLCVAASANYGIVGNGRVYVLQLTPQGIRAEKQFNTQDSVYDVAWSERNENQMVVASGDGSVKLFDLNVNDFPVKTWKEHNREVYAVHWNLVSKDTFASSSWDGTIKIWSPERDTSILTLPTHSCTYSTAWSPHSPSILSSVSSDSHCRIFDLRTPASASNHLVALIPIHGPPPTLGGPPNPMQRTMPPAEALTHDWNKYRNTVLATAGVDTIIRSFDVRNPRDGPIAMLEGHKYAVRKIAWSPHLSDVLLSASYDMTCRVWSDGTNNTNTHPGMATGGGSQIGQMDRHTEFCTGVDWCLFGSEGWCASVAWDERLLVWDVRSQMGPQAHGHQ